MGDRERAVELLTLIEEREASTFETRRKAGQLLAKVVRQLPPETAGAAQAQGRRLDWQTAARRLVEALAAEVEP